MPHPLTRARSIRTHLALMALVVALPLAALLVRSRLAAYRAEVATGSFEAERLADVTSAATTQLLADARGVLQGAAARGGDLLADRESCRTVLVQTREAAPYLVSLLATDPEGEVRCSLRAMPEGAERPYRDRDWFQRVKAGERFVVGSPIVGRITGDWVVALAVPVTGPDGTPAGVLAGSLPLVRFQELLAGVRIQEDELVTVADAERTILARSRDAALHVGRTLPEDTMPASPVGPGRFVAGGPDLDGVERSWANITIPDVGWRVFAGIPTERVRGPALADLREDFLLGLLTLLLAAGLAWYVQRRITDPLRELVGWTRTAGADPAPPPPVRGPTEVRTLAAQLGETLRARSQAELAERTAKERYRSVLDQAVVGITSVDRAGRFLRVNPALAGLLGSDDPEEIEGRSVADLFPGRGVWERVRARLDREGTVRDVEERWLRDDGGTLTVRLNGRRVDEREDGTSYQMIVEDITGQKELELALRHSQKMEAVGRLAGGVAHDFNNLLTVVSGNAELLLAESEPGTAGHAELVEIQMATARAASLTRQLLAFSRKGPEATGPVDVNALLERLEILVARLVGPDVEIRTRYGQVPATVWADPSPLEQTILNICVNARDAMPEGGVLTLDTALVRQPDDLTLPARDEGWVRVGIEDTGSGMSPAVRDRIFEPFFTTKHIGEGTGLGLATSYVAIDALGGSITVSSREGRGTRFEVWLPARVEPAVDDRAAGAAVLETGGSGTLLVAEDEAGVRRFVRRVLETAGFTVLEAADGDAAAELFEARSDEIDLVLTDLVMPGRSGTDLAAVVRARRPDLPVVFMSGYAGDLPVDDVDGADGVLGKPFTMAELVARVQTTLEDSRERMG